MCSKVTSSPSTAHTRLYLMRPMSSSWSWLKCRDFSSVAGYMPTGIDTRPKEMAPFHMVLGMTDLREGSLIVLPAHLGFSASLVDPTDTATMPACPHGRRPPRRSP